MVAPRKLDASSSNLTAGCFDGGKCSFFDGFTSSRASMVGHAISGSQQLKSRRQRGIDWKWDSIAHRMVAALCTAAELG
jgi:hypothetical protein